jgi:hypothetical protein
MDPSQTIKNGLVGYYPFTGNMNDSSGNGNTAVPFVFVRVVSTPTFTTDKYGTPTLLTILMAKVLPTSLK